MRGAVSLKGHDILHVVLGRGLLDQDEAFVLGFTMGSTKNLTCIEQSVFKFVVSRMYPEPYRIPAGLLKSYDLGVSAGKRTGIRNIHKYDLDSLMDKPLGEARRCLGIDMNVVKAAYAEEKESLPGTLGSIRLLVPEHF